MKRLLCPTLPQPHRPAALPSAEAEHALKVLRLRTGDEVLAMDGKGRAVRARIRATGGGNAELEYLGQADSQKGGGPVPVVLELAILKGDAMEWAIEKAVELGARELVPLITDHAVVQVKQKGPESFQVRWQKIADQALKQCGRLERLEVRLPIELPRHLSANPIRSETSVRLWCDETGRGEAPELAQWLTQTPGLSGLQEAHLLVGPEGGWSAQERALLQGEKGTQRVGLGPWVLRAETAALFGLSLLAARFRTG